MVDQEGGHDRKLTAADRQRRALELRRQGLDYAAIADELGYAGRQGAHKAVSSALQRHEAESVDDLRRVEGLRLDDLQRAVWPAAMAGDLAAVGKALEVMARRAKLFGLDTQPRTAVQDEEVKQVAFVWVARDRAVT